MERHNARAAVKAGISFLGVIAGLVLAAEAHDTWLQPERFLVTPGATLVLNLTSADRFAGAQGAFKPERVAQMFGRLGGIELTFGSAIPTAQMLRFAVTLTRPGIAVLGVEEKPWLFELRSEMVETYFREIHAGDELREAWAAVPPPRRWRQSEVKHIKTFVRVGEPAAGESAWEEPIGLGLEIIPGRDPTMLREGDALPVRVWRGRRPFAGFVLTFAAAGETREHVTVTDAEGRASATLDAQGVWFVHGTDLRRLPIADREWESDFTTMVVEVR